MPRMIIECLRLGFILFVASVFFYVSGAQASSQTETFYHDLAARHAPIAFQQTSNHPKGDIITRFDFDGDWAFDNNWDNTDRFPLPATVYYSVTESETHYFITYAFFHPRDYDKVCFPWICHEDDLEGLAVTVAKEGGSSATNDGYGTVLYLETKAHLGMERKLAPVMALAPGHAGGASAGERVAVFVEGGGHGVHPWGSTTPNPDNAGTDVLVFYYAGRSDLPNGAKGGLVGYDLLPLESTLWAHRQELGKGKTFLNTYDYQGTRYSLGEVPNKLNGRKWAPGSASTPWSWADGGEGGLKKGDWFFDPALSIAKRVQLPGPFSLKYLYNPYLNIR